MVIKNEIILPLLTYSLLEYDIFKQDLSKADIVQAIGENLILLDQDVLYETKSKNSWLTTYFFPTMQRHIRSVFQVERIFKDLEKNLNDEIEQEKSYLCVRKNSPVGLKLRRVLLKAKRSVCFYQKIFDCIHKCSEKSSKVCDGVIARKENLKFSYISLLHSYESLKLRKLKKAFYFTKEALSEAQSSRDNICICYSLLMMVWISYESVEGKDTKLTKEEFFCLVELCIQNGEKYFAFDVSIYCLLLKLVLKTYFDSNYTRQEMLTTLSLIETLVYQMISKQDSSGFAMTKTANKSASYRYNIAKSLLSKYLKTKRFILTENMNFNNSEAKSNMLSHSSVNRLEKLFFMRSDLFTELKKAENKIESEEEYMFGMVKIQRVHKTAKEYGFVELKLLGDLLILAVVSENTIDYKAKLDIESSLVDIIKHSYRKGWLGIFRYALTIFKRHVILK